MHQIHELQANIQAYGQRRPTRASTRALAQPTFQSRSTEMPLAHSGRNQHTAQTHPSPQFFPHSKLGGCATYDPFEFHPVLIFKTLAHECFNKVYRDAMSNPHRFFSIDMVPKELWMQFRKGFNDFLVTNKRSEIRNTKPEQETKWPSLSFQTEQGSGMRSST